MEPLLPQSQRNRLAELTCEILRQSGRLSGEITSPVTGKAISGLIAEMNSYYSNLIEGHKTLPREIEKALKNDFSENQEERNNQLLSRAHIKTEQEMLERLASEDTQIHSSAFICWLHERFYSHLPESLRVSKTKSGKEYRVEPGRLRDFPVDVGRHTPPHFEALPRFLDRFQQFYSSKSILETTQLIALAAAHHRLVWIHPFGDGNGRVARLYSHAALLRNNVLDPHGLWTLARGLARRKRDYFAHLQQADATRANDYDGRGNLSDRALGNFCVFFLETILDQINFMAERLQLQTLATRIDFYLQNEALHIQKHRDRLARLLKAAAIEGELPRGNVPEVICASPTVAREVIRLALEEGLLVSAGPKMPLQIAFPVKVLETYFPRLFLDLHVDP